MDDITTLDAFEIGTGGAGKAVGQEAAGAAGKGEKGGGERRGAGRLRRPERRQMAGVAQSPDDLVGPEACGAAGGGGGGACGFGGVAGAHQGAGRSGGTGRDRSPAFGVAVVIRLRAGHRFGARVARQCQENAAFRWRCGGVAVNHRLLSDFRTDHAEALDALFRQVIAALVDKGVGKVSRISQDGMRVRVGAGKKRFRREGRLEQLLAEAERHVAELRRQRESPGGAGLSARQAAARKRAAQERQKRRQEAMAQLPELQAPAGGKGEADGGERGQEIAAQEPRGSTTDAEARMMKMPNGGYDPAVNVPLAADPQSRAIVGVEVSGEGSDSGGLRAPLREQVEQRPGGKVAEPWLEGGYLRKEDLEAAHGQGVALFIPPPTAQDRQKRGKELEPQKGDREALRVCKQRMRSEEGKKIYQQRAATSETLNADLRTYRGLGRILVRGRAKARCVALGSALAYNVMHFAPVLRA